mgnify:CR=1 FL=1|jgi:hypothetical protein
MDKQLDTYLLSVASICIKTNARQLIMSGTPLESKLPLNIWKLILIGKVMTSLMVITFGIGQSAGKVSKFVMVRI